MIDWNKPIQTKYGTPAKLVTTLTVGVQPRIVEYKDPAFLATPDRVERLAVSEDGSLSTEHPYGFIINVPERKAFRNLYQDSSGHLQLGTSQWSSRENAQWAAEAAGASLTLIATYEEKPL